MSSTRDTTSASDRGRNRRPNKPDSSDTDGRDRYEVFSVSLAKTSISMLGHDRLFGLLTHSDLKEVALTAEGLSAHWKAAVENDGNRIFKFVLYFPYCAQKCLYCREPSVKLSDGNQVSDFLKDAVREMEFFSPVFSGREFDYLTVNGGSPDLLSPAQMEELFSVLFSRFSFSDRSERRIELNPIGMSREKLAVMRKHGFTRLSFGVQSLSREALSRANRPFVGMTELTHAFAVAREVGFDDINADLILGLPGETYEGFEAGLRQVVSLRPAQVMVYVLNEPNERYLTRYPELDADRFREGVERMVAEFSKSRLIDEICDMGYSLVPDPKDINYKYFVFVRSDIPALAWLSEMDRHISISSFSIGRKSVANIFGNLVYERTADFDSAGGLYRGSTIGRGYEMKKFIFSSVEAAGTIDVALFRAIFGEDIGYRFGDAVSILKTHGRVAVRDGKILFLGTGSKERLTDLAFFLLNMKSIRE